MAEALSLSSVIADRAIELLKLAHASGIISLGLKGQRAVPGTLYLAARVHSVPLSLLEVCQLSDADWVSVARMLPRLLPLLGGAVTVLDPAMFLERYAQLCGYSRGEVSMAVQVSEVARQGWVTEGRLVQPIALACLLLSHAQATKRRVDGLEIKRTADLCGLVAKTVTARLHELETLLLKQAQQLPWPVDKKLLHLHLEDILRFTMPAEETMPPSVQPRIREQDSIDAKLEQILLEQGLDEAEVRRASSRRLRILFQKAFNDEEPENEELFN